MTKTITPSQLVIEGFIFQWQKFKQKLPVELQQEFDRLMKYAIEHPHPDPEGVPFQQIVMSILIEQEKEIKRLRSKLNTNITKKCPRCRTERNKDDFKGALCPDCREYLLFSLPKPDKPD
jgi:hypothetical protein